MADTGNHTTAKCSPTQDQFAETARLFNSNCNTNGDNHNIRQDEPGPLWHNTFWRLAPILSMFCLMGASAGIASNFYVIQSTCPPDAMFVPVSIWTRHVFSLISVISNFSDALIKAAIALALPTDWWLRAMRGEMLVTLQREWEAGQGLFSALRSHRLFGLAGLTIAACTLLLTAAPLSQRAIVAGTGYASIPQDISVRAPTTLPSSWAGTIYADGAYKPSPGLNTAFEKSVYKEYCSLHITKCDTECLLTLSAPGLSAHSCQSSLLDIDQDNLSAWPGSDVDKHVLFQISFGTQYTSNNTWFGIEGTSPSELPLPHPNYESLAIAITRANLINGVGTLNTTQCWFVPATLDYRVHVVGSNLVESMNASHLSNGNSSLFGSRTDKIDPIEGHGFGNVISTAAEMSRPVFCTDYTFHGSANGDLSMYTGGLSEFSEPYITDDQFSNFTVEDPLDDIVSFMNGLLFRGAAVIGRNSDSIPYQQATDSKVLNLVVVFVCQTRYFYAATTIQVFAMSLVFPLLWGYWRLGRPVSLSPFETAKAFGAPLLNTVSPNASQQEILAAFKNVKIRYGVVDAPQATVHTSDKTQRNATEVQAFQFKRGVTDCMIEMTGTVRQVLGFGLYADVDKPRKRQRFSA